MAKEKTFNTGFQLSVVGPVPLYFRMEEKKELGRETLRRCFKEGKGKVPPRRNVVKWLSKDSTTQI